MREIVEKKVATFLAGSLESQLGIEIQSLENTEHCQVGQMSVGLDSVALYRFELPQNALKKMSAFLAGSLEAQYSDQDRTNVPA